MEDGLSKTLICCSNRLDKNFADTVLRLLSVMLLDMKRNIILDGIGPIATFYLCKKYSYSIVTTINILLHYKHFIKYDKLTIFE